MLSRTTSIIQILLIIGYGSVSQCALPLIIDFFLLKQKLTSITIIDTVYVQSKLQSYLNQYKQIKSHQELVTKDNYEKIFEKYLSSNDILLDLAFNLKTRCLLKWCHDHNIYFINTSIELWDPFVAVYLGEPRLLTLYHRQMQLIDMQNDQNSNKNGPTAIIDHGCNPGLVSHFFKRALIDMTEYILRQSQIPTAADNRHEFEQTLKTKNYPQLAYLLDIKTIHISERDTQITNKPKQFNEFVNTWSVDGLSEEAIASAQIGWGTHQSWASTDFLEYEYNKIAPENENFEYDCFQTPVLRRFSIIIEYMGSLLHKVERQNKSAT